MNRTQPPLMLLISAALLLTNCEGVPDFCTESGGGDFVEGCTESANPLVLGEHTAQALERSPYHVLPFAADAMYVYWAACSGDILQTLKGGGVTSVLIPGEGCNVGGLAVNGQHLFVARTCRGGLQESTALLAYSKSGKDPLLLATQRGAAGPLMLVQERLFWTTRVGEDSSTLWSMLDLPGAQPETIASESSPYLPFTVDVTSVYWVEGRELMRQPLDGGGGTQLAILDDAVESFVVGGNQPRWVSIDPYDTESERELWRLSSTEPGTPVQELAGTVTKLMAGTGKTLYGAGHLESDGVVSLRLYRWTGAGEKPEPLAAPLHWPEAIALDERHVYWVDAPESCSSTRLMRVTR